MSQFHVLMFKLVLRRLLLSQSQQFLIDHFNHLLVSSKVLNLYELFIYYDNVLFPPITISWNILLIHDLMAILAIS